MYELEVHFKQPGVYITMEQCHECDALCSGMIEQVLEDIVLWHSIKNMQDVNTAYRWLRSHFKHETILLYHSHITGSVDTPKFLKKMEE